MSPKPVSSEGSANSARNRSFLRSRNTPRHCSPSMNSKREPSYNHTSAKLGDNPEEKHELLGLFLEAVYLVSVVAAIAAVFYVLSLVASY